MKWIKATERVPTDGRTVYLKSDAVKDVRGQYVIGLDCFFGNQTEDYIDKDFIEWLDESEGWIPVDADVPKETYLLLFNGNWTGVGKCTMVDDFEDEDGPLVQRWEDETSEFISPMPTHFMALPEPPKI